ncbi:Lrp/AsnC family transcriptional regulator [Streptomyces olivaceiscleroticus]|uniref:AsnC family transcriptional regulator n=1 Tax=Streptomyces olivaceiscleroticus TaxID=68245 RepID=A0ABN1AU19_9ACTN
MTAADTSHAADTGQGPDALDRRIIAALQIDGRASWRRIAAALGEPERTVARRGLHLLDSGQVTVTGLVARGETAIVRLGCPPGTARDAALAMARRADTIFSYVLSGSPDCVAEVQCPPGRLAALMLDEAPPVPGLLAQHVSPVLRYFRTVHDWHPGILGEAEVAALSRFPVRPGGAGAPARFQDGGPARPEAAGGPAEELGPEERRIVEALAEDGRRTHEELAALAGVSEATARRRVEALTRTGAVSIRAAVEPALLGLPVEALLWIRTRPDAVEAVGRLLTESPLVRYAAVVMGEHQLLVDVTQPSMTALHAFLTEEPWVRHVEAVSSHLVVAAMKRSATPTPLMRSLGA